jgi:hypothetical protein
VETGPAPIWESLYGKDKADQPINAKISTGAEAASNLGQIQTTLDTLDPVGQPIDPPGMLGNYLENFLYFTRVGMIESWPSRRILSCS